MVNEEWEFLGSDVLTNPGDNIDVTGLAIRKNIQVLGFYIGSGNIQEQLRMNSLSGNIYARRASDNGAADTTEVNQAQLKIDSVDPTSSPRFDVTDIVNVNGEEKLVICQLVTRGVAGTGVGSAPNRSQIVGKMVPSPLTTDITEINMINLQTGDFDTGSSVDVHGAN